MAMRTSALMIMLKLENKMIKPRTKNADIAIGAIFAIFLAIIVIGIIIAFTADKTKMSQKIYCNTVGKLIDKDLSYAADDPCDPYGDLQTTPFKRYVKSSSEFSNHQQEMSIALQAGVPHAVHFTYPDVAIIGSLSFDAQTTHITTLEMIVDQDLVDYLTVFSSDELTMTESGQRSLPRECAGMCDVNVTFVSAVDTTLMLSNLKLDYLEYEIAADLTDNIMDCWSRSGQGKASKSFLCEDLPLPHDYIYGDEISEQAISDILLDRQLCHILANSDHGCGEDDNLDVEDLGGNTNVLVEYDGKNKMVKVS